MNKTLCLVASAAALVPCLALAQDQSGGQIAQAYDFICSNRSTVEPILETLVGGSVVLHGVGIWMKKRGLTAAATTSWAGKAFAIIRILNGDVHPPPAAIVAAAASTLTASPEIVKATGVDPTKVAAAADALKGAKT